MMKFGISYSLPSEEIAPRAEMTKYRFDSAKKELGEHMSNSADIRWRVVPPNNTGAPNQCCYVQGEVMLMAVADYHAMMEFLCNSMDPYKFECLKQIIHLQENA